MQTTTIAGLKVYDYSKRTPPVAKLDPAVGESRTVITPLPEPTPAEAIEAAHIARYNDDNLRGAIIELEKAQNEVYQIAEQMLYEHESPYYAYCAHGGGGRDYSEYADGTPWAKRRKYLSGLTKKWNPYSQRIVRVIEPKQPRGFWARLFARNEPAQD